MAYLSGSCISDALNICIFLVQVFLVVYLRCFSPDAMHIARDDVLIHLSSGNIGESQCINVFRFCYIKGKPHIAFDKS